MKEYNRLLDEQEEQRAHELAARMERFLGKSKQKGRRQELEGAKNDQGVSTRFGITRKWWRYIPPISIYNM